MTKYEIGEIPMKSLKPVILLVSIGLICIFSFQNCSKPKGAAETPQYGNSTSSTLLSSEKDMSIINLPVLPDHFENLTTGVEIYGSCVISNTTRDFTLMVNERSGKTDCAIKCNENVVKFPGDKITCAFPGGSSNTSIETTKNYCRILVNDKDVKLDSYSLDQASCISQCQIIGKDMDKEQGLKCEWQKRLLYYRVTDNVTPIDLGSCTVIAKNSMGVPVANIVYNSGTTEESCSNIVTKLTEKYQSGDVTYVFTKVEYVVIQ